MNRNKGKYLEEFGHNRHAFFYFIKSDKRLVVVSFLNLYLFGFRSGKKELQLCLESLTDSTRVPINKTECYAELLFFSTVTRDYSSIQDAIAAMASCQHLIRWCIFLFWETHRSDVLHLLIKLFSL